MLAKNRISNLWFFIFFLVSTCGYTQDLRRKPDLMMMGEDNMLIYTPSLFKDSTKLELLTGSESGLGDYSPIRTFYTYLYSNASHHHTSQKAKIGLFASSEQIGPFIQQNYLRIDYGRKISLSENHSISFGLSGGLINAFIKSSPSTSGSSTWLPDLNASLTYQFRDGHFSVYGGQLLRKKLEVQIPTTIYDRFYQVSFYRHFRFINGNKVSIFSRYLIYDQSDNEIEVTGRFHYQKKMFFGVMIRRLYGAGIEAGLQHVELLDLYFSLSMGYKFNNFHSHLANVQRVHALLILHLK